MSLDSQVVEQAKKLLSLGYDSPEYWAAQAELAKRSTWYFLRFHLDLGFLCEDLHGGRLIPFIENNEDSDIAILIPRGHGKTLCVSSVLLKWIVCNPNHSLMCASATDSLAQGIGSYMASQLMKNERVQKSFASVVPSQKSETELWGQGGYSLPGRKSRVDPTLFMASLNTNVTGRHPDLIWCDDLIVEQTNNALGWEKARKFLNNCKALLPPTGRLILTGTRWHDSDIYDGVISGEIQGNRGPFKVLILSCFEDDDIKRAEPIYKPKVRWNMSESSGYSSELLLRKRSDMGPFFNAQFRNDPVPSDEQPLDMGSISLIDREDLPSLGKVHAVGIEVTGGGRILHTTLIEEIEKLKLFMPVVEVKITKKQGVDKHDRILGALEPMVRQGRFHMMKWMKGNSPSDTNCLWYELNRLGAAKHDDIADSIHIVRDHLQKGVLPTEKEPADIYIGVDVAFTEKESSDFTVATACAVDHKGNFYVLDYDRFKLKSPTAIVGRIIEFYQKWNTEEGQSYSKQRKKGSTWISTYK